MVRWIEDNNNIGNILKFSGYSRLFSSRDKTTEDDIVSIIGVKSEDYRRIHITQDRKV